MDRKKWKSVDKLIDSALDLCPEERLEFIRNQCGDDKQLMAEAIEFINGIEKSESEKFLETPFGFFDELTCEIDESVGSKPDSSLIGETIENYKILELIERGGMGSVFVAERTDDAYRKKVALKLMKRGLDTPSNIARFRRERNILANLDHPNVTHLLDGGITSEGLPFLVMDYVVGTPLLEFCEENQCCIEKRLELFKKICRTVQYAHKNAIIHRDLKPSNILVTEEGKVKVLDFGIAKLMKGDDERRGGEMDRGEDTIFTLRYAAPEQVAAGSVTTSTDIHGLGVILYELLTGRHPFDTDVKGISEIKEIIENHRPREPSQQLKKLTAEEQKKISVNRKTIPEELVQQLSGDLDAIVCKALSKDPDDRYSSVEKLMEDLERIEKHQPLSAREHTLGYKTAKFYHRKKKEIAVVTTFILILAGFFSYHTIQINEERNIAQQEARTADEVTAFLLKLFDTNSNQDTLSAASLLEQGMEHLQEMENEPAHSNMLAVMGEAYMNFGEYEKAEELLREAVIKSREIHGEASLDHANSLYTMGRLFENRYDWEEAVSIFQKSYDLHAELLGENHHKTVDVLTRLSAALRNTGQLEKAEKYARRAVERHEKVLEPTNAELLAASANLAYVLRKRDKFAEAESMYVQVLEKAVDNSDIEETTLAEYYNNQGYLYRDQERYGEAVENYREAVFLKEQSYPAGHPELINSRRNLATSLYFLDSLEQAGNLFKENVSEIREKYSTHHWRTASALNTLGVFHLENRHYKAAEPFLRESIQINRQVLGKDHLWTAYSEGLLAACLKFQQKDTELADSLYHHHVKLFKEQQNKFDTNNLHQLKRLARIHEINDTRDSVYLAYRDLLD